MNLIDRIIKSAPNCEPVLDNGQTHRNNVVAAVIVIFLTVAVTSILTLQGWKGRFPGEDLVPHVRLAWQLLENGQIPTHAGISSRGTFNPPGTIFLTAIGVALFDDPRLWEFGGSLLPFAGTLIGLLLLARQYLKLRDALWVPVLYAFSPWGFFFSSSLWPRGHPFFYVWMLFFAGLWVSQRKDRYLAAAIVVWAAGMYVFMEIITAVLLLPVLWYLYRPPVRLRWLVFATLLSILIWYPYLSFEEGRGFGDLGALLIPQVFGQGIRNPETSQLKPLQNQTCVISSKTLDEGNSPDSQTPASSQSRGSDPFLTFRSVSMKAIAPLWMLTTNNLVLSTNGLENLVRVSPGIPFVFPFLLFCVLAGLFLLGIQAWPATGRRLVSLIMHLPAPATSFMGGSSIVFGTLLMLVFAFPNRWMSSLTLDRSVSQTRVFEATQMGFCLIVLGSLLLLRRNILESILKWIGNRVTLTQLPVCLHRKRCGVLWIGLVVPWLTLLILIDFGHYTRLLWLWPVQLLILYLFVVQGAKRLLGEKHGMLLSNLGMVSLLFLTNPLATGRISSWYHAGWEGQDANEVRILNSLATDMKDRGLSQSSIGYYMPSRLDAVGGDWSGQHAKDSVYKLAMDLDMLLWAQHGVVNTDTCANGLSVNDTYRILQVDSSSIHLSLAEVLGGMAGYRFIAAVGPYALFRHDATQ